MAPARAPTAVGVVGGSGAGKTTIVAAVVALAGPGAAAVLRQDSYYRDLSHLPLAERARANFDAPAALDLARLAGDLEALRRGEAVVPPAYDFATHTRRGDGDPVAPAGLLLVEGTAILAEPRVAAALDLLVWVELPEEERLARRIARDVAGRGRTEASVRRQWAESVLPMHREHVAPLCARADLVLSGAEPAEAAARRILAAI